MIDDLQRQVQAAIDELVESGAERGLQVAVYRHGELVVDAVAGVADPATGRPVTSDTPIFSYSVGKGVAATVVHVLAERGVFTYDTPIVELWPEFGAHGKERATVRHALSQSVGVPGLPTDVTVADMCDWQKMCALVAGAEPWWEPGTKIGYHAVQERLARLEDAEGSAEMFAGMPADSPVFKLGPPECTTAAYGNRADVRSADIPAGGTVNRLTPGFDTAQRIAGIVTNAVAGS